MASMLAHGLDKIPDVQGHLVISSDGAVLASAGDLENDEKTAATLVNMLQTATMIPLSGDRTQTFKRMSIHFEDFVMMVTVSNQRIFVVKRPIGQEGY